MSNKTSERLLALSKSDKAIGGWSVAGEKGFVSLNKDIEAIAAKYQRMEKVLEEVDRVIVLTTRDPIYQHEVLRHVRDALSFDPLADA